MSQSAVAYRETMVGLNLWWPYASHGNPPRLLPGWVIALRRGELQMSQGECFLYMGGWWESWRGKQLRNTALRRPSTAIFWTRLSPLLPKRGEARWNEAGRRKLIAAYLQINSTGLDSVCSRDKSEILCLAKVFVCSSCWSCYYFLESDESRPVCAQSESEVRYCSCPCICD